MKIIGTTATGYLVEMSKTEVALAAGYRGEYDDEFTKALGLPSWREPLRIGTVIDVRKAHDFHSRIAEHQDAARKGAGTLRALADLLDGAMPDVLVPPADPQAAPGNQETPTDA